MRFYYRIKQDAAWGSWMVMRAESPRAPRTAWDVIGVYVHKAEAQAAVARLRETAG